MPTLERDLAKAAVGVLADGDVTDDFVEALVDELIEGDPFCDHSVGICACETLGLIGELRLALNGRETCGVCWGEGFSYRSAHNSSCNKFLERGYDCDDAHFSTCWLCGGKGWVMQREFYGGWRWGR